MLVFCYDVTHMKQVHNLDMGISSILTVGLGSGMRSTECLQCFATTKFLSIFSFNTVATN